MGSKLKQSVKQTKKFNSKDSRGHIQKTMKTKILKPEEIDIAAEIIRKGGIVGFPTETVYGLGADALNSKAIEKIFKAKGRPQDNPLIVHISSLKQLKKLTCSIPKKAYKLAKAFWPGPLTIILKKSKIVPDNVTAGLKTIAIRMPSDPIAHALIEKSGTPIAAPSANTSGKPSPTHHTHVIEDLKGKVDAIIEGGYVKIGVESTVIDLTKTIPSILRPGRITPRMVQQKIGFVSIFSKIRSNISRPASPGMKYRHYSPKAKVLLVPSSTKQNEITRKIARKEVDAGRKVMVLSRRKGRLKGGKWIFLGEKIIDMSRKVFDAFRKADNEKFDVIIVEGTRETGMGLAIMNRLKKAASLIVTNELFEEKYKD